jgi:hypothetical protein
VIAGKSLLAFRREAGEEEELSHQCLALVQTYDEKPEPRLFEMLRRGAANESAGGVSFRRRRDVRNVPLYWNLGAEQLLDWFPITMRWTVINPMAKGLPETVGKDEAPYELRPSVLQDLEPLQWYLWHGQVFQAWKRLDGLPMDVESAAFETKDENRLETSAADRRAAQLLWSDNPAFRTGPYARAE